MVTAANLVQKWVRERPMIEESLRQGLVNYAALAERMHKHVEAGLGKKATMPAIVMALRRYQEQLQGNEPKKATALFGREIIMKTGIADIGVMKSASLAAKLEKLYKIVDLSKGDTLNLVHGNHEASIITSEKYMEKVLAVLIPEKVILREKGLVALSLSISEQHIYTPGTIFIAARQLAWDNVNIFEIISTATELTFIVSRKDAIRAYNSLSELASGQHQA